jgi:hypothetical protein
MGGGRAGLGVGLRCLQYLPPFFLHRSSSGVGGGTNGGIGVGQQNSLSAFGLSGSSACHAYSWSETVHRASDTQSYAKGPQRCTHLKYSNVQDQTRGKGADTAYLGHAELFDARVKVVAANGVLAALGNARQAPLKLKLRGPASRTWGVRSWLSASVAVEPCFVHLNGGTSLLWEMGVAATLQVKRL